ncbi:MAG: hypothetical protein ACOYYS_22280 [Chloroflexota bacterium]
MNTLSRAITAQILTDPTIYNKLQRHWSALVHSPRKHKLTAAHHLLYLALLGKDWRKGFTCVTNRRKLENGAFYNWKLFRALATLHSPSREAALLAPFDGLVTPAMLQQIRQLIPARNAYTHQPNQFIDHNFPFKAYSVPVQASNHGGIHA